MQPTLTIAIPTFNRKEKLKKCIENVLKQIVTNEVEILVSDNASTDGTQELIEQVNRESKVITYYRNAENLGPDRNFLNCYEKAKGKYVLLLGDDDILLPGSVKSILCALQNNPIFLHLNTCTLLSNESTLEYTEPRFVEEGVKCFVDKNLYLEAIGIYITFVSSLVLRTEYVKNVVDKEQYMGTYFLQSHIALETLKNDGLYMILTKNCVAATGNKTVNYDIYYVWGEQYHKLLYNTAINCGFKHETIKKMYHNDLRHTLKEFVIFYRKACKNSEHWKTECFLDNIKQQPLFYIQYYFLMKAHPFFVDCYCFYKRVVNKILNILHIRK